MKLAFPNGEHGEIAIGKGSISIGSSDDDDVVIKSDGMQAGHAVIIVDKRGMTLSVETEDHDLKVNDRLVREKAILRPGDRVTIRGTEMRLQADSSQISAPPEGATICPPEDAKLPMPAKHLLRGLAGDFFGRMSPINERVVIGQGDSCDVVISGEGIADEHLAVENTDAGILLRSLGSQDGAEVNGVMVTEAVLKAGDQLVIGAQRFLIEAPGYVPARLFEAPKEEVEGSNTQVFSALDLTQADSGSDEAPAASEEEAAEEVDSGSNKKRDAIIITVCLALSVFMLVWLYMNI